MRGAFYRRMLTSSTNRKVSHGRVDLRAEIGKLAYSSFSSGSENLALERQHRRCSVKRSRNTRGIDNGPEFES